jgi:hypothetical protein
MVNLRNLPTYNIFLAGECTFYHSWQHIKVVCNQGGSRHLYIYILRSGSLAVSELNNHHYFGAIKIIAALLGHAIGAIGASFSGI